MRKFRKVIFWLHLICGSLAGIAIFIMCASGAILSFEKNILEFAESDMRNVVPPTGGTRLPFSELTQRLLEQRPNLKPTAVLVESSPSRAVIYSLGREGQIFVNPYSGEITGEGLRGLRAVFSKAEDAHRWLALGGSGRAVGKTINDAANFVFLILAITGVYIWMPRQLNWRHARPNVWFRRGLKGKGRDFNWHNVIGFWMSLVLIVLTLTGVVISYQWAGNLVYTLTGNQPPTQQGPPGSVPQNVQIDQPFSFPANIDELWHTASNQSPGWKLISLRLPISKDAVFTIDDGKSLNIFGRSTLTLDTATTAVNKWEPYEQQNSGRKLRSWIRFTHTGESFGIIGQLIGFLACIGGAFLVYTGLSLALRRLRNWLKRQATRRAVAEQPI